MEFLGGFAESAAYGEQPGSGGDGVAPVGGDDAASDEDDAAARDTGGDDEPGVTEACPAVRPTLYTAVLPFLGGTDPAVSEAAEGAVASLLMAPTSRGTYRPPPTTCAPPSPATGGAGASAAPRC